MTQAICGLPLCHLCLSIVSAVLMTSCNSPTFPQPRIALQAVSLSSLWEAASFVAIGKMTDVHRTGNGQVFRPKRGSPFTIYPCRAAFSPSSSIKGANPAALTNFFWFSVAADCPLANRFQTNSGSDKTVRVWFLRQENSWLRPIVDNAAVFLDIAPPPEMPGIDSRVAFARSLLSPATVLIIPEAAAGRLLELYGLACAVGGERLCDELLASLQTQAPDPLKNAICRLAALPLGECDIRDCRDDGILPTSNVTALSELQHHPDTMFTEMARIASVGTATQKAAIRTQLMVLSCNFDKGAKARAVALLRKYFPDEPPLPCIACK